MKIDTLHFLVHPGFALALEKRTLESVVKLPREIDREREKELLDTYRRKIDSLDERDVLVLFSPSDKEERLKDFNASEAWIELEKQARRKLGRRCIVLSDPDFLEWGFSEERSESLDTVSKIVSAREFEFSPDTPSEVWGTDVRRCVSNTAKWVFKQFQLNEYPVIPVRATDQKDIRDGEIAALEARLREDYPKAKLENRL